MRRLGTALFLLALLAASTASAATLKVRALGDPQTLDWNRATTWMDGLLIYNLMEGLVTVDAKLNPVPALAMRWSISPDHKTFTFFLRKGVKWSDGVPLRAQDFVNGWKRLLSAETAARYASVLFDIENAEDFNKGKISDFTKVGVKATDDSTLVVKLRAPVAYWYWIPTSYATFPIRQDLIDKNPSGWDKAKTMVSVGPYVLGNHEPGRSISLTKNPHYYGKHGNIDQVAFALISDDSTALRLYELGQLDFLAKISPLEKKRLRGRKDFKSWPELRTIHLALNIHQNPTSNEAFRKALLLSIDRSKLTKVFEGDYQPATSFVPPGLIGHDKTAKGESGGLSEKFDPEKARAILKQEGFTPESMRPIDLLTVAFDDHVILAQFIQDELKRNLGVTVRIHILEPKRYYSPLLNHSEFAMQINLWGADFPDPDNFLSVFLGSSTLSRYHWQNDKYDALIQGARSQKETSLRNRSYLQAQKILQESAVVTIPLYYARISALVRPTIQGFNPGPMSWWFFKNLSMK